MFDVNYLCRFRRSFLPVHLLYLTPLLGHSSAVAEDLEEQFRSGAGQGDKAHLVDDQQVQAGHLPMEVEQPSLVPSPQRSALPRFHRRVAQRGSLAGVLRRPGAAGPPDLPHGHGVRKAGHSRRHRLETALFTAPAGNPPLS